MVINEKNANLNNRENIYPSHQVSIILALLCLLFILAGILPLDGYWGINHLQYFSSIFVIIFAAIIVLLFIPRIQTALFNVSKYIIKVFSRMPRLARFAAAALISGCAFYILRVHVHSLGDGYMRVGQIETGIRYLHTEPLDFWLHGLLYDFLNTFGAVSGEKAYQIFSIGVGIVFILILYGANLKNGPVGNNGALLKWLVLCFGGLQLFFGYVESYALFYSAMIIYSLFAYRFLVAGHGFFAASMAFAVGLACHLTGFFFLPTYLYLAYKAIKTAKAPITKLSYWGFTIVIVIAVALLISELITRTHHSQYLVGPGDYFLPPITGDYAVLSGHHLLDILNQLLLIIPVPLGLLVPLILFGKSNPQSDIRVFGIILTACAGFFLLAINPSLGYARDWDLFATSTALIGINILILYFRKCAPISQVKLVFPAALAFVLLSIWILTNSSPQRQLQRAENLLSLSDKGHGYGTELLAHYYRYQAKDNQKVLDLLGTITGPSRNARVLRIMAVTMYEMGRYREALATAREGLLLDSAVAELNYIAGQSLTELGFIDTATAYLEKAQHYDSRNYVFTRSLARNYYTRGRIAIAIEGYKYAILLEPRKHAGYFDVAAIYHEAGVYDSAYFYAQAGLKIAPDFRPGYELLDAIKAAARNQLQNPPAQR